MFLKVLQISPENTCVGVSFSKVAVPRPAILLKRDCNTDVFQWSFAKILRAPILKNICKRVFLEVLTWDVYSAPRQTSKLEGLTRIWNASNDDASKFQKGKKIVILYWTFCSQCNYNNFFSRKKNLLKERNQI